MNRELKKYVEREVLGAKYTFGSIFVKRLFSSQADALYLLRSYLIWTKEHTHPILRRINRIQLERKYGIYCGNEVKIGIGLSFPHPTGIIIGKGTEIGENVTIYQQVTFGGKEIGKSSKEKSYPTIGDNCVFYKGCTIVGCINVEDNTIVGANAFLNNSTQSGIYVGVPAKKVGEISDVEDKEHN